jgi:2-methylisocitrate lyase-like PEP mutase family enzyme
VHFLSSQQAAAEIQIEDFSSKKKFGNLTRKKLIGAIILFV